MLNRNVRRGFPFLIFFASLLLGPNAVATSPLVGGIAFTNNGTARLTIAKSYDSLDRLTAVSSINSQPSTINSFTHGYNNTSLRTAITNEAGAYWVYQYDSLGHVKSGRRHWADGTPVAGQQHEFDYDNIGNVLAAGTGGDSSGLNLRWASNTFNTVNQFTARTTPGYVESFGTAHSNATVTVNLQPTHRHGDYYRAELTVNNSTALWQAVTNIGVLNDGSNPDIVTTNLSYLFVPAASTSLLYDPDGNLTNDGHFSYTWNSENQLTSVASLTNTPAESKRKLTFEYDALGRRIRAGVSRWTNSTWLVTASNKFVYDGWNLVAELNATNNNLIRSYVWGLDLSGTMDNDAGGVGGLLWVNDASTLGSNSTHCVAYDGNGNVSALADSFNPFHESASWNGYSADYFRQSLASATGFGIFGNYDQCDKNLASTRMLGRSSTLALEIFAPLGAARWAASGSGLLRAAALGLDAYSLHESAEAIGSGAGKLSAGDGWGAVEMGLGLLGVKPGINGVMRGGARLAAEARGLASAARNASIVTRSGTHEVASVDRWYDQAAVMANMRSSPLGRMVTEAAEANVFRLEFSKSLYRWMPAAGTKRHGMSMGRSGI